MLSNVKRLAYNISTATLRWYYNRMWGMDIGEGVRISRSAKLDMTNPKGLKIGKYTAVAFNASILTHDFVNGSHKSVEIGENCLIGAGSLIMPGVKIGDSCIVGPASVVLTNVPSNSVVFGNPARVIEQNIVTGRWGIRNPEFLRQQNVAVPETAAAAPAPVQRAAPVDTSPSGRRSLVQSYLPDVRDIEKTFDDLEIDSFALVTLRAEIEESEGSAIPDADWTEIKRPSDLLRFITKPKGQRSGQVVGATARRSYEINMPQMALGGLSESWLYKEVGDIHWSLLTSALGVESSKISDQSGARLYATFTRLRYRSNIPLAKVRENEAFDATAAMTRFGAGMFFSSVQFKSDQNEIAFEVMSSFSMFGESGENTSLIKGQPELPKNFSVPSLPELPGFATEYRALRAEDPGASVFETEYEIVPQHDINGVGLLYFAAYPVISDICLMRYLGKGAAFEWSSSERDVCYFANSGPEDRLTYRVHNDNHADNMRTIDSTLSRASDGKRMALIRVTLQR